MFNDNYDTLQSLTYLYRKDNGTTVDVRLHDGEVYLSEDMLAILLEIPIESLYTLVIKAVDNNSLAINQHLRYHAWYGSSNGKIYKLLGKNILGYKANAENTLEDDKLKIIFSIEAIELLLESLKQDELQRFNKFCEQIKSDSQKFSFFIQAIICGVDDTISKIHFDDELNIVQMQMPRDNEFLRYYWQVLDVFHFGYRFGKARINGVHINTLMTRKSSRPLSEIKDKNNALDFSCTHLPFIADKVNIILHQFKIIRLFTRKPIWCSEIIRSIEAQAMGNSNPYASINVYKYNNKPYMISDDEARYLNLKLKEFSFPLNDEIINLALSNYDYSFFVPESIAIIILITCLEIIFHPGDRDELKYRIARNAAVFIGKNESHSGLLFDILKRLYDLRSALVHSGRINLSRLPECKDEDGVIDKLRDIVSESIIEYKSKILDKGLTREKFFSILNSKGFGDNPFEI